MAYGQGVGSFYPNGFANGVSVLGMPVLNMQSGKVWWVSSALGADGNPGTFKAPFATWNRAFAFTQPGDQIVLMANHRETIASSTALAISTSGVATIGVGVPGYRPTITLSTATTTTIAVSGSGCSVTNVLFQTSIAALASVFTLAVAKGFTLDRCKFTSAAATYALSIVTTDTTTNDADNLSVTNCEWIDTSTSVNYMVSVLGTEDKITFSNNYVNIGVQNDVCAGVNVAAGKVVTNFIGTNNQMLRLNTSNTAGLLFGTNGSTNSGIIDNNRGYTLVAGTPLWAPATTGLSYGVNYITGVADKSGFILPTQDS